MRKFKSGNRWCAWRWTLLPHIDRLFLVRTPLAAIVLHFIKHPDPRRDPHDHPVSFLSIPLRGSYVELVGRRGEDIDSSRVRLIRATHVHQIIWVSDGGCVTLCFMGPKRREWGYWTDEGWVPWRDYR